MDVSTLAITTDPISHRKVINGTYCINRRIGEGSFGKVLLAEVISGVASSDSPSAQHQQNQSLQSLQADQQQQGSHSSVTSFFANPKDAYSSSPSSLFSQPGGPGSRPGSRRGSQAGSDFLAGGSRAGSRPGSGSSVASSSAPPPPPPPPAAAPMTGSNPGSRPGSRPGSGSGPSPAQFVAIKTINRIEKHKLITKTYLSHTTKIKREIAIMKECNHPNVVKLYQVIDDLKFDKILLVLEYCPFGEIDWKTYNHYNEKYYKQGNGITINRILRDVVNGLDYLHRIKKIIHRDLKPSNLLISSNKTIKISDFGVSLILENNANDEKELGKSMGTPAFFAPELCQFVNNRYSMIKESTGGGAAAGTGAAKIDAKIDLWSLGVILYCLVFHSLPFNGDNEFRLFKNIVTQKLKFPKIRNSSLATVEDMEEIGYLKDLIEKLLIKEPKDRIDLQAIKEHKFTTFDLSMEERKEFIEYNKRYEQPAPSKSSTSGGSGAISKIKKFFGAPTTTTTTANTTTTNSTSLQTSASAAVNKAINSSEPTRINPSTLEQVDDLLDSYFDDSSSFGSLEEDEEDDETDPELEEPEVSVEIPDSDKEITPKISPKADVASSNRGSSSAESGEGFDTSNILKSVSSGSLSSRSKHNLPPILISSSSDALNSPIDKFSKPRSISSPTKYSPMNSPISSASSITSNSSSSNVVTIGAGSPTIFKSMFSPSRRFFSKVGKSKRDQVEVVKPTINSLSSPNYEVGSGAEPESYSDIFRPPNVLGGSMIAGQSSHGNGMGANNSGGGSNNNNSGGGGGGGSNASSRKNSFSSIRSNGLSRITSSSSSLNLNGYLTDDAYSLHSTTARNSNSNSLKYKIDPDLNRGSSSDNESSDNEEADETLTGEQIVQNQQPPSFSSSKLKQRLNMNDYLDRLD